LYPTYTNNPNIAKLNVATINLNSACSNKMPKSNPPPKTASFFSFDKLLNQSRNLSGERFIVWAGFLGAC
jgi:hypothetical protein